MSLLELQSYTDVEYTCSERFTTSSFPDFIKLWATEHFHLLWIVLDVTISHRNWALILLQEVWPTGLHYLEFLVMIMGWWYASAGSNINGFPLCTHVSTWELCFSIWYLLQVDLDFGANQIKFLYLTIAGSKGGYTKWIGDHAWHWDDGCGWR